MSGVPILWQKRCRPPGKMLAFATLLGVLLGAGSVLLVHALMTEPDWLVAGFWGGALGVAVVGWVAAGSSLRLTAEGSLIYALRGADCAVIDARQVVRVVPVDTGVLVGAGLVCPPTAVTLLSRKGFSHHDMDQWQQHLGVTVVAEFLRPDDCAALQNALQRIHHPLVTPS